MNWLKTLLVAPAFVALATLPTIGGAAGQGLSEAVYDITFAAPGNTFTFEISKAQGAGQLMVDTRDCCIAGDKWKLVVDPNLPRAAKKDAAGTGDGSTTIFSGSAVTMPFVAGTVTVSFDSGVNVFPAGMSVRFAYSKATGVNITAPAGAVLVSSTP
jgi:hypothetical protein